MMPLNTILLRYAFLRVISRGPKIVGIYRLTMKTDSDNFRASAIQGIIERLKELNINVVIYEPTLDKGTFEDCAVIKDFDSFANISDVIIANRLDETLSNVQDKVYTRDLFTRD